MHILLVEDDNETASYLEGSQRKWSRLNRASDEKKACLWPLLNFDALIVDRMLPELDGLTLITKIREKIQHTNNNSIDIKMK